MLRPVVGPKDAKMSQSAASLARLVTLAEGFDRSWSFSEAGVEERALFFLPLAAAPTLREVAQGLGFEAPGLAEFDAALPGADAIGFTIAERGSLRLYLQYWDAMAARVAAGDLSPGPLYLGIKQFEDGRARRDVYHCLPLAPQEEYRPEIEAALIGFGADAQAVAGLLGRLSPEACIWTRTQNAGRTSWLATLRRADIPSQLLIEALSPIADRAGVGDVIAALRRGAPLHIAGGTDAGKGQFLTFYVESDASEMAHFLHRAL